MTAHGLDAPDVLTDGAWLPQRGVRVWVADPRPERAAPQPAIAMLLSCPSCRAQVGQTCRTRTGHTTTPHACRLTPRLCACGSLLGSRRRYCDPCRDLALQAAKNEHGRRNQSVKNAWGRAARMRIQGRCWVPLGGGRRSLCGLAFAECAEHAIARLGLQEPA